MEVLQFFKNAFEQGYGLIITESEDQTLGDVDGDGELDLAIGNYDMTQFGAPYHSAVQIYLNSNGMLSQSADWSFDLGTTKSIAWADVDDSGEMDMFEFANALRVADIADLPPWDVEKLVKIMDINSDGRINLPELDIALLNIRNTLGIEFIPYEEEEEAEEEAEEETEDSSNAPSEAELKKMKKAELVDVAKSMGLKTNGTKADLIERITQA